MKCPACTTTELLMSERQGIEIDYCPACRGVWLDRGELDKIIERTVPPEAAVPPQPRTAPHPGYPGSGHVPPQGHGYSHGYSHGNKPYRKKSFLEELFD